MDINRIKTAIDFLKDGQSFAVEDLRLAIKGRTVVITGWSQCKDIKNLTKDQSLSELESVRTSFTQMVSISNEMKTFVLNKEVLFNLYFDDYGKGSIIICSEMQGIVQWKMDLR